MNYFAENLTDLLRIRNITQKGLAEKLGVLPSTVNQWTKGKREPEYDMLIKICCLLDTEPTELLGYYKAKTNM
ncbi:MAG: helix-turn-helix transcriptional regulator [Clostridia bacterium]|nr:helix-turn-helix transcriptional regulator [Clostridia bacterium]